MAGHGIRAAVAAACLMVCALPASSARAAMPPVEYFDEPAQQPPLAAALTAVLDTCPAVRNALPMMDRIAPSWRNTRLSAEWRQQTGWDWFVDIVFYPRDPLQVYLAFGPGMPDIYADRGIEYWAGSGAHPGILPRSVQAYFMCAQPLPADLRRIIPAPALQHLGPPPPH